MRDRLERELKVWIGPEAALCRVYSSLACFSALDSAIFSCVTSRGSHSDWLNYLIPPLLHASLDTLASLSLWVRCTPIQSVASLVEDQLSQLCQLCQFRELCAWPSQSEEFRWQVSSGPVCYVCLLSAFLWYASCFRITPFLTFVF